MEKQTRLGNYNKDLDWHQYNLSQTREKTLFLKLLKELCALVEEPEHQKGRKPKPLKDVIYAICLKTYNNTSSRRIQSDLRLAREAHHMDNGVPFNTLLDHLEREDLRYVLKDLIEISALPLKNLEHDFAIDGTGFSINRYSTYFNVKHLRKDKWKAYRKCHAVCGVASNIIVAVDITKGYQHDVTKFEELARDTARNFTIENFTADKAYLSKKNYNLIKELGGQAWIPFKSSNTGQSTCGGNSYTWRTMFRFFRDHADEFYAKYNCRQNIESCFSMIKRKFGNNVKCKKETSQDNEILAKILCHNLCVLIQELFLSNIDINFYQEFSGYVARKYL